MVLNEEKIKEAQRILQKEYYCHTVILYGSYAKGNMISKSDVDMMGVSDKRETIKRDARIWKNTYLDLFIYPDEKILNPDETLLYMRTSKIIFEKNNIGTKFISDLNNIFKKGPKKLSDDELHARKIWYPKMLNRAKLGDVEGNFRKQHLLITLLEDYFHFRNQWYEGPKYSFDWLKNNDPEVFKLFDQCFKSSASFNQIRTLINLVISP